MRCCSAWIGVPLRLAVDDPKDPWQGEELRSVGFRVKFCFNEFAQLFNYLLKRHLGK